MGISTSDSSSIDQILRIGQFIMFILGIAGVLWKLSGMATKFEMTGKAHGERMDKMEISIAKLVDVQVAQAVQNARLDNHGAQITTLLNEVSALRRGEGFIQHKVDGEWPR
jgi:hypothetical protein